MARPRKFDVAYFPHKIEVGDSLFVLEQKWGNTGYAFLYKLLESLCKAPNLYLDFRNDAKLEVFAAKTRVSVTETIDILNTLSKLKKIDKDLWELRVVWCQDLIDSLIPLFKKRTSLIPGKPDFGSENPGFRDGNEPKPIVSGPEINQSKVKINNSTVPPNPLNNEPEIVWNGTCFKIDLLQYITWMNQLDLTKYQLNLALDRIDREMSMRKGRYDNAIGYVVKVLMNLQDSKGLERFINTHKGNGDPNLKFIGKNLVT